MFLFIGVENARTVYHSQDHVRFGWHIAQVPDQVSQPSSRRVFQDSKLLKYLSKNGRLMDSLLQRIDGEPACVDDLAQLQGIVSQYILVK